MLWSVSFNHADKCAAVHRDFVKGVAGDGRECLQVRLTNLCPLPKRQLDSRAIQFESHHHRDAAQVACEVGFEGEEADAFMNVNTPEELKLAERKLAGR